MHRIIKGLLAGIVVSSFVAVSIGQAQSTTTLEAEISKLSTEMANLSAAIASLESKLNFQDGRSTSQGQSTYRLKDLADFGLARNCQARAGYECEAVAMRNCQNLGHSKSVKFVAVDQLTLDDAGKSIPGYRRILSVTCAD